MPKHATQVQAMRMPNSIAFIGSSISYNGGNAGLNSGVFNITTSFVVNALIMSGWRVEPVLNASVGGDGTGGMLQNQLPNVLALSPSPGVCVVEVGPNDSKGAVPAATSKNNLTAIFDALQAASIHCIVLTGTPSDLIDQPAEKSAFFEVNEWVKRQGQVRRGLTVVDVYPHISDPSNVLWASGYSEDLTHPNHLGAKEMARPLIAALETLFPPMPPLGGGGGDPFEIIANPRMVGNNGGLATSYVRTGGVAVGSKVPRTDGIPGEWQRIDQSSGSGFFQQNLVSGWAVGDTLVGTAEIVVDEDAQFTSFFLAVEARNAAFASLLQTNCGGTSSTSARVPPLGGIYRTPRLVVPAGTTQVRLFIFSAGAGRFDVGAMSMRRAGQ